MIRWPKEKTIYLSGPYTSPDPVANTHKAALITLELEAKGWLVVMPHQSLLRHLVKPMPYRYWMNLDLKLLSLCGAWTRFDPGTSSPGSEEELGAAQALGLAIYDTHELVPFVDDLRGPNGG